MISSQKKLIEKRAEELNDQFRIKWQWLMMILIAYGGLTTLFTGFKSERVILNCISTFKTVVNMFTKITGIIDRISGQITEAIGIPETVTVMFVAIVVFGIIGTIMFFGGRIIINVYQEYCYDELSLLVVLVSIAALIWFAELMPLNIVLMLILSHIVYIDVRWYTKGYKENH